MTIITACPVPTHVQGYLVDRKQGIDKCWPYVMLFLSPDHVRLHH